MANWMQLADGGDYAAALVAFVADYQPVTFFEVIDSLADHIEVAGEYGLHVSNHPNVIVWGGMSLEIVRLITTLLNDGKLFLKPADATPYQMNGQVMTLPIVENVPSEPLAERHWLPRLLSTEPSGVSYRVEFNPEWN